MPRILPILGLILKTFRGAPPPPRTQIGTTSKNCPNSPAVSEWSGIYNIMYPCYSMDIESSPLLMYVVNLKALN